MKLSNIIENEYSNVTQKDTLLEQYQKNNQDNKNGLLFSLWNKCNEQFTLFDLNALELERDNITRIINQPNLREISPQEITSFCVDLANHQNDPFFECAGSFLSCIINIHHMQTKYAEKYFIPVFQLNTPLRLLCDNNTANVEVEGSVKSYFCNMMKSGIVTLNGNCKNFVGNEMSGGTMYINGNAEDNLGNEMSGGTIYVAGNVGEHAGSKLSNGSIHIKGNYKSLAYYIPMGKVYHLGKRIVPP